jgi:CheY-like chemotaxis protein
MQLLIVHHESKIGDELVKIVREHTSHRAHFVSSDAAALSWAEQHSECDLLLAQLDADGIDGLKLGDSFRENFPGIQTMFMPPYRASEQRLDVLHTKVFPEPIDSERLLSAITRATQLETGAIDPFHVVDVLQMFCLSRKSGALQMVKGNQNSLVYLQDGELLDAETAQSRGLDAIYEIVGWDYVEFAHDAGTSPNETTIKVAWDTALVDAVLRRKKAKAYDRHGAPSDNSCKTSFPLERDLTGRDFGIYRVGRKLSESFWAEIYQAEQTSVGRSVALYVLRSNLRNYPVRAQEFLAQASANANVQHPALLSVYEAGQCNGTYFYAREFVAGETLLDSRLSKKTISEALALRIVASVAAAISYLDENHVLHAPLRLTRIFISPDGQARLADIAVANPANAQTAPAKSEIQMLGRMLIPVVKADSSRESGHVLTLLHRMQSSGTDAIASWGQLKEETKNLEPIVGPPQVRKSSKTTNLIQKMKLWRSGS